MCMCVHDRARLPRGGGGSGSGGGGGVTVAQCMRGDDAAPGRSGEWSTAVVAIMRLCALPGYCSRIIHSRVKRAEALGPVA